MSTTIKIQPTKGIQFNHSEGGLKVQPDHIGSFNHNEGGLKIAK